MSRLALAGRQQDIQLFIRRLARRYRGSLPEVSAGLTTLLHELPSRSSPLRGEAVAPIPVDMDTRLQLVRYEAAPHLDVEPIYSPVIWEALRQLVSERRNQGLLEDAGLVPTRTALFTGPPGVGKSLAVRWLARELSLPVLMLDLAAVMSSFLGRTGTNVRRILDYAKQVDCILLIDELDAVAKRRDDTTEIGELKRLVTVLLQEVDDWPAGALLVAATNHPGLLDPAVWRRFELKVEFPMPNAEAVREAVRNFMGPDGNMLAKWDALLATTFTGTSYSEIELSMNRARKAAVLNGGDIEPHLQALVSERAASLPHEDRVALAVALVSNGASQRRAHELTGLARETIRKATTCRNTTEGG